MLFYLSPLGDKVARVCVKCFSVEVEDYEKVVKRLPRENILGRKL
jgi:hypothetical protein